MSVSRFETSMMRRLLWFGLAIGWIIPVQAQYIQAIPPENPTLGAVTGDRSVKLYWDATPEDDIDPVLQALYPNDPTRWNNFEGYKIYRATDYQFKEAFTITDGFGQPRYYKPVAVFDRVNRVKGYFRGNSGLGIPLVFNNFSENTFEQTLPPFYPDIQPIGLNADLLAESANGTWQVTIRDHDSTKNMGQLTSWKIGFRSQGQTAFAHEYTGGITHLNVIENPAFERFDNSDPVSWERYQPESMSFYRTVSGTGDGSALGIRITDFWDEGTSNRIGNGEFRVAADTAAFDQLLNNASVGLRWQMKYGPDSTGWLRMQVNSDTIAGVRFNIITGNQILANEWAAFVIRLGGENLPPQARVYLSLNDGVEKIVDLGTVPDTVRELRYYRKMINRLTKVSVYVKRAQGATIYIDRIGVFSAQYLTQEVYQRLPRVVPGSNYIWKVKIFDNDPALKITPGYRAYLPNQAIQEFRQFGFESTANSADYQYFQRSFTAPANLQDGIFYFRVDVIGDAWGDSAWFEIDSVTMVGNSKWGLNLYPEVSSAITVQSGPVQWDDFQITLDIAHPWLYELQISLTAPSGREYPLMDGEFARSYLDGTNGIAQYMGSNSGLEYTWTDTSVLNGQRYFYAVVAYDHGDSLYNILPAEGEKTIVILNQAYQFSNNTVMAIPNPYVPGYSAPSLSGQGLEHAGFGTGGAAIDIIDARQIRDGHRYEVRFFDTSNDPTYQPVSSLDYYLKKTTSYTVTNLTTGAKLLEYVTALSQPSIVFEGLRLRVANESTIRIQSDSIRWYGSALTHPQLSVQTTNLGNPLAGNRYAAIYKILFLEDKSDTSIYYRQGFTTLPPTPFNVSIFNLLENEPVKYGYLKVSGSDDFILYPMLADTHDVAGNPVNYPYKSTWYIKLIFNSSNLISNRGSDLGGIFHWQDADSTVSYVRKTGFGNIPPQNTGEATLLYWNTNPPTPAAPVDVILKADTVSAPGLYYFNGWFKATRPQQITFGIPGADTTFTVTTTYTNYAIPVEIHESGYLRLTWHATGDDSLWIYKISFREKYRYQAGDYVIIPTTVPFRGNDVFEFTTRAATALTAADRPWQNFRVVPNPYILSASWDYPADTPGLFPNKISFMNVPEKARIRIFTVRGDLVRTLEQSGDLFDATIAWDLKNRDGQKVSYGVYIYHIQTEKYGEKTGKLAVIR